MQHLLTRAYEVQQQLSILATPDHGSIVSTVLNSLPLMVWICDADGLCTYANDRWLEFRGRTIGEEAGMGWTSGIHPDDAASCLQLFNGALDAHKPTTMELRILAASGQYRFVLNVGVPRFTREGQFVGYLGAAMDISELKAAEQYAVQLHAISPGAPQPATLLTKRELEVLELVADGLPNTQIAKRLNICTATVETHRSQLLKRLQVPNSAALVRRAMRLGLLAP